MTKSNDKTNQPIMSRRRMLTRLGLTATALYVAPVMLQLSDAHAASGFAGGSRSRASFSRGHHRTTSTKSTKSTRSTRPTRSTRSTRGRRRHGRVKSFSR